MPADILGVGFLGAGPVTQAIHLPVLAQLRDSFRVIKVMDVDAQLARSIAEQVDADWTSDADSVIADNDVDVVVVCSPNQFHAEQVIAACEANKKAILCEKPLAVSREEAEAIARISSETGVPIIVGAMHTFDPAWLAVKKHWDALTEKAHTIRYSIILPPNPRFEDFSTEVLGRPTHQTSRDANDPNVAASMVHGGIMGLAIHDLPLVRSFCADTSSVVLSCHRPPHGGYVITAQAGDVNLHISAYNTTGWEPVWRLEAISDDVALEIEFTPSYVQGGSAIATLTTRDTRHVYGPYENTGYVEEWTFIADAVAGRCQPLDMDVLVADLAFAVDIADQSAQLVRSTHRQEREQ